MTTPTGYLVNTTTGTDASYTDLSYIFKALVAGTIPASATGFTNSAGNDLNTIFNPKGSTSIDYNTNMISLTGEDLSQVFAPYTPTAFYTVTGATYFESTYSDYTGVVCYIPFGSIPSSGQMTGTITFNKAVSANIIIVGGGAGGGGYYTQVPGGAVPGTGNVWLGCGGGGGATITVPLTLAASNPYKFAVGQGGNGGNTYINNLTQTSGANSYFTNGTVSYTAGGGTVTSPTASTTNIGFQNSSGGNVKINGTAPAGFIGGGGGGGGGNAQITSVSYLMQGTGGTGGSNYNGLNFGQTGSTAFYTTNSLQNSLWVGGAGGYSYFQNSSGGVSTPFSSSVTSMPVGGGGGGGYYITDGTGYWCGNAGQGSGGQSISSGYGWAPNANNNSYSEINLSSGGSGIPGPTGIQYGYGAGGGSPYTNFASVSPSTGGFGGNGVVIIYWDNTQFS